MIRSYTFNYKNRYQSFPIDITLRLCLSIPECGDIIIPFFVKKFDNLDFIYPSNEITKDFNIERTNPLLEETSFNCKQEFINEVRHIFNSNSDDIIIESGVKKQTDIYVILVDCNKEGIFLEEIQKKFLFLTLINPEINKSDFEEIAKADNEVIFKIPGSNYPIKIVSDEILIDQIPQNIQTIKLSIFGDDLSAIHSVRQCLLDRIHTISNNIQMNKIHINTNDVDKSIIYEIKKAIIFTLDSVMLNQKNKHEKMEKVNSLYNKKSETKEYKLKTFKYIKRELQNLYKKFEDLCDDNKDEITINSLNSKMIDMYNNLMELNGLLQTLDSIHMEVCFIDRSYFLYV
ncbi:hypothetical protein LY90DRAFT_514391 [Neocallimastix californiae]|uniref:Uncharacterized protein n=1 Tax=Neocallimastix californiae TaxID=1754190 RepID=A0A1Y2AQT7_9FUNG|nr:hypothetical protein LY90DRAFT_514391 [Neocallimastix californiae]|eukprot:ORY24923.1 hypothetical protein LY90DRAFT_514391 [Neocallimastix californiae]